MNIQDGTEEDVELFHPEMPEFTKRIRYEDLWPQQAITEFLDGYNKPKREVINIETIEAVFHGRVSYRVWHWEWVET